MDFMEYNERVTSTNQNQDEEGVEFTLRPKKLEDYIGQKTATENLRVFIEAAQMRHEPLDHVLFYGPPGL